MIGQIFKHVQQCSNESINPFNSLELQYLRFISFCASLYTGLSDGEARNMLAAFLEASPPEERLFGRKSQVNMCNYDCTTWIQSTIGFSIKKLQLDSFSFSWCYDQYMLILSWQNNWWWGTQSHNLLFDPLASGLPRHNTHRLSRDLQGIDFNDRPAETY